MPHRLRLPAALAATLVVAEAAVLLLRPRERYAKVPVEPRAYFSDAELEKAKRFRRGQLAIFAAQTGLELGLLAAAARRTPRDGGVVVGAATAAALTLGTGVAALPLRAVARRRAKRVGLVTQSWGGWAVDVAKGAAIGGAFSAAGGAALTAGIRRFGAGWWAPGAAVGVGVAVVFTYLGPIVLDPLFNRFTPLPDGELRADVLDLARRAGVDVGEVFEVDASKRTTAANAYVNGLGSTKRVVLYDTLLREFTPAETRLVVAHELGHVRHRDVIFGLLWLALVAPFAALAVASAVELMTPEGASAVPAAALALTLVAPGIGVISNQLSRAIERRADAFALGLTGEPDAAIGLERRLTLQNVGDPAPPRWQQVLLGTHPDTMERIGQALAFRSRRSPAGA